MVSGRTSHSLFDAVLQSFVFAFGFVFFRAHLLCFVAGFRMARGLWICQKRGKEFSGPVQTIFVDNPDFHPVGGTTKVGLDPFSQ